MFSYILCNSQEQAPFYEQIAFDYYRNEILPQFPFKKKININNRIRDTRYLLYPLCISKDKKARKFLFNGNDELIEKRLNLLYIDLKKFKIKNNLNHRKFNLEVSKNEFLKSDNYIDVIINIGHKTKVLIYHILMNNKGKVLKYCLDGEYKYDF